MSSEFGYIPESPNQSFGNNKGIFTPTDIYDLTRADKYTQYGQLELIETKSADDSTATIDFDTLGNYNVHFLTANDVSGASTSAQDIKIRVKVGGTAQSSGYQKALVNGQSDGTFFDGNGTSENGFIYLPDVDNETNAKANGYSYIYNAIDSTKYTFSTYHIEVFQSAVGARFRFGSNVFPTANSCSGLRLTTTTGGGNIKTGTFSLYGIKEYS